jgi:glutathione peroxidase
MLEGVGLDMAVSCTKQQILGVTDVNTKNMAAGQGLAFAFQPAGIWPLELQENRMPRVPFATLAATWLLAALAPLQAAAQTAAAAACPALLKQTQPRLQDEKPISLCDYGGRVLLVVNTASYCGFTPQYRSLEALHEKLAPRGFAVLGFPSNDFGQQEPGSNKEIADFCENTFGVRFPMFAKSHVAGDKGGPVNPLFAQLAQATGQSPKWNFHKYLIGRQGQIVASWNSMTDPQDPKVLKEIEKLLDAK